ncbi:hypothetical protein [Adlercreutzia muris]|uniref:Uncharacterized protein n=1 Tax=Adlercreutzia muris TaxID=1796610 RepID=A0A7C8FWU5_9ACTN|nr:hypothetical protein [Adlercreutzia muris]KAB1647980.1 hypothetical protein F8D48_06720 [Adlercreutzia muris]MCR2027728.1 hypothetical protein [Adlercreutzia muris]
MSELKRGDYVEFVGPFGDAEFGRVASVADNGRAFVCFSTGCTAAACDPAHLRKVEPRAWMEQLGFGYHRFDDECPDYYPGCCAAYCPEKGGAR